MYLLRSLQSFISVPYLRWRDLYEVDMNQRAREAGGRMMEGASAVEAMADKYIEMTTFKTARDRHPPKSSDPVLLPMSMATLEVFYAEDIFGTAVPGGGGNESSNDSSNDDDDDDDFYYDDTGTIVSSGMNPDSHWQPLAPPRLARRRQWR